MFSAYLVSVLNVGFVLSYTALFDDVMTAFSSSRAEAAVVNSALTVIGLCAGLPAGLIIHRFGSYAVGLGGSLISSLGLMASFFVTSIAHMVVCISIVYGIGFGCIFVSTQSIVSQTFNGKKGLVMMSILGTGAGVGGSIYPFTLRYLSDAYGFRGALLLVGSIVLNTAPLCILWKPVTRGTQDIYNNKQKKNEQNISPLPLSDTGNKTENTAEGYRDNQLEWSTPSHNDKLHGTEMSATGNNKPQHRAKMTETPHFDMQYIQEISPQVGSNVQHGNVSPKNDECTQLRMATNTQTNISSEYETDLNCSNSFNSHSSTDPMMVYRKDESSLTRLTITEDLKETSNLARNQSQQKRSIRLTMLHLLKNQRFAMYALGTVLVSPCFSIVLAFVVDIFLDKGFTKEDASLGLTLLYVGSIVGRLLPGLLLQSKHFPVLGGPALTATMEIILFIALTFAHSRQLTVSVCALIGVTIGMASSGVSVTTVEIVGRELLPNAIGLLTFLLGLGSAFSGIISGYRRDSTNSYDSSLLGAAGVAALGLILFCIAAARKGRDNQQVPRNKQATVYYITKL